MRYKSVDEWLAKGAELFGTNILNWAFICPMCGKISTGKDFKDLGVDPNHIYNTCIGRYNGKGISGLSFKGDTPPEFGCDWAAFGILKTFGRGDIVIKDDHEINVFKFAPQQQEEYNNGK